MIGVTFAATMAAAAIPVSHAVARITVIAANLER